MSEPVNVFERLVMQEQFPYERRERRKVRFAAGEPLGTKSLDVVDELIARRLRPFAVFERRVSLTGRTADTGGRLIPASPVPVTERRPRTTREAGAGAVTSADAPLDLSR